MKKIFTLIIMCICALGVTAQNRSFPYTIVGVASSKVQIYKNDKLLQMADNNQLLVSWLTVYEDKIVDHAEKTTYKLVARDGNMSCYQAPDIKDPSLGLARPMLLIQNINSVTNCTIVHIMELPNYSMRSMTGIHHMDIADFNALVNQCNLGGGVSVEDSSRYIPSDNPARQMLEKNKSYWQDNYGYKDCHICYGSGTCQTCNGDGLFHSAGSTLRCPNCQHGKTGKCGICGGTGKVYRRK
ncbi:MAG: hypothetical protein IKA07_00055 [Alistipes sp.]|nr:hypothetical protein [Alistipes sp.]